MNGLIQWYIKILSGLQEVMECAKWSLDIESKSLGTHVL